VAPPGANGTITRTEILPFAMQGYQEYVLFGKTCMISIACSCILLNAWAAAFI